MANVPDRANNANRRPEPNPGFKFSDTQDPRQRYAEVHEAFKGQGLENRSGGDLSAMVRHPNDMPGTSYSYGTAKLMMDHYDRHKANAANPDLHYHTGSIDAQYGYPLNEHGDWALDERMNVTDDSISEIHNGKKDCKGTDCQYYKMSKADRQPYHAWAVEHS